MSNIDKIFSREEEYENARRRMLRRKKSKSRKSKIAIVSGFMALIVSSGAFISSRLRGKKQEVKSDVTTKTVETVTAEETKAMSGKSLDDLEIQLELPKKNENNSVGVIYNNPTGNVKIEEIVEDDNGTLWVNKEAESNKESVGEVKIDNKNDSLEVIDTDEAYEKDTGYEIKNEDGEVIEEGNVDDNGIPSGYAWDSARGEYVPIDEVGKYVYNKNGELVSVDDISITNPDILDNEEIVDVKTEYKDITEDVTPDEPSEDITDVDSYGGVVNPDGTYTIFGTTYMDRATFEAFVSGDMEEFGYLDGVIYPNSYLEELNKEFTLTK